MVDRVADQIGQCKRDGVWLNGYKGFSATRFEREIIAKPTPRRFGRSVCIRDAKLGFTSRGAGSGGGGSSRSLLFFPERLQVNRLIRGVLAFANLSQSSGRFPAFSIFVKTLSAQIAVTPHRNSIKAAPGNGQVSAVSKKRITDRCGRGQSAWWRDETDLVGEQSAIPDITPEKARCLATTFKD